MITFVMLTWNSEKTVRDALDSILHVLSENLVKNFDIYIVDNGSTDRTLSILDQYAKHRQIKTIKLDKNYGTTISRNIALKKIRHEFVCIIDSDVELQTWDISKSLDFIRNNHCLLAPSLSFANGVFQNSVKKFPTLTIKLLKLTKIFFGIGRFAEMDFYKEMPFKEISRVETAISAFWLFPSFFLDQVGLLDEKIYYSPEDIDYCVRIRKAGYPIYYYPEIKALHHTQQISHAKPFSKISRSHLSGLIYYHFKHQYFFAAEKIRRLPVHSRSTNTEPII